MIVDSVSSGVLGSVGQVALIAQLDGADFVALLVIGTFSRHLATSRSVSSLGRSFVVRAFASQRLRMRGTGQI